VIVACWLGARFAADRVAADLFFAAFLAFIAISVSRSKLCSKKNAAQNVRHYSFNT